MALSRALVPVRMDGVSDGPVATTFTLLFRPLWPIIIPATEWRKSAAAADHTIPDSLLDPLRIWILDCFPERALVRQLIQAGDGSGLPDRDPLEDSGWADPLERASELLWRRAAHVLSRPMPEAVLTEIAESSGLKTPTIEALLPSIQFVFAQARHFFPSRDEVGPVTCDGEELDTLLANAMNGGMTTWSFALMLLFASRTEIDLVLPAARAVAHTRPDAKLWLDRCDAVLAETFNLFEARCDRIDREIGLTEVTERKERRVLLWLEPAEQATISALIRFANRCSLHVLTAARLKASAARATRAQFMLLIEEDLQLAWPVAAWTDARMVAFEQGNRRFRQLALLGRMFTRFVDYRAALGQLVEHYAGDQVPGLTYTERMHAIEILEESSTASQPLTDYLALMPPPAYSKFSLRKTFSFTDTRVGRAYGPLVTE
ncbi:hypothetical protein [Acetobacter conturbans]|uniref:Uncharacterized protein n=1 Tax=Acetobacter conturbans TaxID=1737472 RepID=A0ABX0K1W3_9PROT|nr:hypothetical protein [Acetobacter conturbans]NHN87997.1 hypothetical protein [Acetobacter conturbans]